MRVISIFIALALFLVNCESKKGIKYGDVEVVFKVLAQNEEVIDIDFYNDNFFVLTNHHNLYVLNSNEEVFSVSEIWPTPINPDGTVKFYEGNYFSSFYIWEDKVYFIGQNPGDILVTDLNGEIIKVIKPDYGFEGLHYLKYFKENKIYIQVYNPGKYINRFILFEINLSDASIILASDVKLEIDSKYIQLNISDSSGIIAIHPELNYPFKINIDDTVELHYCLPVSNIRYKGEINKGVSTIEDWYRLSKSQKNNMFPDKYLDFYSKNGRLLVLSKLRDRGEKAFSPFLVTYGDSVKVKEYLFEQHSFVKLLGESGYYIGVKDCDDYKVLKLQQIPLLEEDVIEEG
ncbi:hypothetical protein [Litoribacter populi]|uniref:hypothetical protein n=1 Tax=Litoribacter populi TaxID=2598460 RepID=UPI00117F70CE|nr:hypothetical protein [Litoribacter populi]